MIRAEIFTKWKSDGFGLAPDVPVNTVEMCDTTCTKTPAVGQQVVVEIAVKKQSDLNGYIVLWSKGDENNATI